MNFFYNIYNKLEINFKNKWLTICGDGWFDKINKIPVKYYINGYKIVKKGTFWSVSMFLHVLQFRDSENADLISWIYGFY